MPIRIEVAQSRVEYAEEHGDAAACAHYGIKPATLDRYRSLLSQAERDEDNWSDLLGEKKPTDWTGWERLEGDWLIINDLQLPFACWETLAKAWRVARLLNLKKLVINGDLVDFDRISSYDTSSEQYSTVDQLKLMSSFLKRCLEWFDEIVVTMGNHDERVIRALKKLKKMSGSDEFQMLIELCGGDPSMSPYEIFKSFCDHDGKVTLSEYPRCDIEGKYAVVHPAAYSRIAGRTEAHLAGLFRMHVFGAHGHLFGMMFEPSGTNFGIQPGAATEPNYHRYKNINITTHPDWQKGFAWIKDGKAGFYLNHPDFFNVLDYADVFGDI